jgi:MacB-like periplasmic core domain
MRTLGDLAVEGNIRTAVSLRGGTREDVRPILAQMVSGNYFSMLGAAAATGRALGAPYERPGTTGVPVVLSYRFWTRAFANSRTLLGSTLIIQGRPFVIVGIMPQSFFGTRIDESADVWLPLSAQPLLSNKSHTDPDPDRHFAILARLRNGVTLPQAQQEFAGVYRTIHHRDEPTDTGAQGSLLPIAESSFALRDPFRHALTLLLWGLAALLLMMCANVGGLLLARTARRERDTAVRIAAGSAAQCGCCHVGGGPGLVLELFQKRPFLRKGRQRRPDLCRSMQLCMHTRQQQKTSQPRVGLGRLRVAPVHANSTFIRCAGVPYEPRSSARIDGRDRLTVQ